MLLRCRCCRFNDLEAVEDYVAIGKGGVTDEEGRTALHYGAAYDNAKVGLERDLLCGLGLGSACATLSMY